MCGGGGTLIFNLTAECYTKCILEIYESPSNGYIVSISKYVYNTIVYEITVRHEIFAGSKFCGFFSDLQE